MQNSLFVVPTNRACRNRLKERAADVPAPKFLTTKEFEERLVFLPNRVAIGDIARKLALKRASDRLKNGGGLGIPTEFLVFLEHAPFFLKFFDELSQYGVEPDELLGGDTYAEYDDHVAALKALKSLYREELAKEGFTDRGLLAECGALNLSWLKEFASVCVEIEGVPTPFELRLIEEAAKTIPLSILTCPSPFDVRIKSVLEPLKEFAEINEHKIELAGDFRLFCVKERLAQTYAIASEVFYYVERGVKPEAIVVVLPDDDFAAFMRRFDRFNLFNYAMGVSLSEGKFYRTLEALLNYDEDAAARAYINRKKIDTDWNELSDLSRFADAKKIGGKSEKDVALETLAELLPVLNAQPLEKNDALRLYLQSLSEKSFDDVSGGTITVLSVLETRANVFDTVIVADFNDDRLPHRNEKDLFLNAAIRARAGLPTYADREDNERSFYWRLFAKARHRTILCVKNDTSQPSRFIKELGIKNEPLFYPPNDELALPFKPIKKRSIETIAIEINLAEKPLSATKLTSYLTCKRQFYFRYIKNLKEDEFFEERSIDRETGVLLHEALKNGETKEAVIEYLRSRTNGDLRLEFETTLWEARLDRYFALEKRRNAEGWKTLFREKKVEFEYGGVKFNGAIDRVDQNGGEYLVIDYKSGKIPSQKTPEKQSDFQPLIYRQYMLENGYENVNAAYYDLKNGALERFDCEKYAAAFNAALKTYLNIKQNFTQCESFAPCRFCPYVIPCERA
jgi:RecB family exonuclease